MCHVERYARSASIQRLHGPSTQGDNLVPPKSPKYKRNERPVENTTGGKDIEGNVNDNDPEVQKETPTDNEGKTLEDDGKTISFGGAIKATMAFPHKKAKSILEDDKNAPMDKINEELDEQERSQKA